jgi:hypothetical protein
MRCAWRRCEFLNVFLLQNVFLSHSYCLPAAIPYNTGSHLKYFTKGREVYDEYYGYMLRCSSIWDIRHKEIMWEKMVHFLRTADSDRTAEWWRKHWQGPWTLGDCGYANCTHQNHQEGKWRPVRRGTGCGASGDERQALGTFTSKLIEYARSASEDHEQQSDRFRPSK